MRTCTESPTCILGASYGYPTDKEPDTTDKEPDTTDKEPEKEPGILRASYGQGTGHNRT